MKSFFVVISLCLFLVSCKNGEESIVEIPIEGDGHIYASSGYQQVESFAKSFDSSVKIMAVRSQDVNIGGSSKSWTYEFVSTDKMILYLFTRTFDSIGLDSTTEMKTGNSVISNTWINSNVALSAAENNGGKAFRNKHTNCQISASLSEPLIPNSAPLWYIKYSSSTEYLYVVINAITGKYVSN
jgi:hypothetical protein